MATKVLTAFDLTLNELQNAKIQNLGTDPGTGNKGRIWYDSTNNLFKGDNGTAVDKLTNVLESISIGTANGLSVAGISGKNQAVSLALASGSAAGAMSTTHYSLVNGATNANTASTLVQRDASGNFSAGTITAALTGTASNASNLNGQAPSYYLARANATGTQTASTISDLATTVQGYTLNSFAAPTGPVAMGSQRITGLADPTAASDAATKNYVDATSAGLDFKESVRAGSTANVAGTYNATGGTAGRGQFTAMPNSIDGVTLAANDRVLLKNQTTGAQNGIWVVTTLGTGANGVWDRATDFDTDSEVTSGAFMFVEEGTTNATTSWVLSTPNPITIGGASGTSLTFSQFGAGNTYSAGNGLSLAGNSFSVVGTANRITVSGSGVDIASTYVGQTSITTLGSIATGTWNATAIAVAHGGTGGTTAAAAKTGLGFLTRYAQTLSTSATSYTVTHNLGTLDVQIEIIEVATGNVVITDAQATTTNTVTITFATAPAANAYRVIVIG